MKKNNERIVWLDVLRGVAILLVLLFHFTTRYGEKYPANAFANALFVRFTFGWIGVHLFFMISGFIIYRSIQQKKGSLEFLVARLSRLLPPFWSAIVLILILEFIHARMFGIQNRNDFVTTILNVVMIPDIVKASFLDGAFWSLFVEIKFYLLFALLWSLVDLKKSSTYYISYGILLLFASIHNIVYHLPLGEHFDYFLIFWTGIAACKVLYEKMPIWVYGLLTALTTASTLGLYTKGPELLLAVPIFSASFLIFANMFKRYQKLELIFYPVSRLGRVSYSYYLIHQPVGYLILGAAAGLAVNHYLGILLAFSACFGVALLGFTYIEQLNRPIAAYIMSKIEPRCNEEVSLL